MGQTFSSIYNIFTPTESTTHDPPTTSSSPSNPNSSDTENKETTSVIQSDITPIIKEEPLDLPLLDFLIKQNVDVKEIMEQIQAHNKQQSSRYPQLTSALHTFLSLNSPYNIFNTKLDKCLCAVSIPTSSKNNLGSMKKKYPETAQIMSDMCAPRQDEHQGVKTIKTIAGKILVATGKVHFFDKTFQLNDEHDLQLGLINICDSNLFSSNDNGIIAFDFIKISLKMHDNKMNQVSIGSSKIYVMIDTYYGTKCTIDFKALFPNQEIRQQVISTLK